MDLQIENSRFCRPDILKKLTEAVENAKVSHVCLKYVHVIMCSTCTCMCFEEPKCMTLCLCIPFALKSAHFCALSKTA